jgi:hypothetical protein
VASPTAGNYFMAINGYSAYSGVSLKVTYMANGKMVSQTVTFEESALKVYPNPANGSVNMNLSNLSKDVEAVMVKIVDMNGKVVLTQSVSANEGNAEGMLDISSLKGGIYFVNVIGNDFKQTQKLVVR